MPRHATSLLLALALLACGDDKGDDKGEDTESDPSSTTGPGPGTTSTAPTTGDMGTTDGSDSMTATGPGTTTDVGMPVFERFRLNFTDGSCLPRADCDGFVELLATRKLRVEKVGDVGNPVTEVEISETDFATAVGVYTNPEVAAALDGPDPLCELPPTEFFESMELVLGGVLHDATTTACTQMPVIAARETARALQMVYVP